jgi:hypothetical protein
MNPLAINMINSPESLTKAMPENTIHRGHREAKLGEGQNWHWPPKIWVKRVVFQVA